jgi:hypothetical protein
MRRIIVTIILIVSLVLTSSTSVYAPQELPSPFQEAPISPEGINLQAESQGSGNNIPVVQFMHRMLPDQLISLSNSFSSINTHAAIIDLTSYQISGWTLYDVIIDVDNITAINEREVVGTTAATQSNNFAIWEYETALYYDQLAQGFYNQGHDGKLQNLSILYQSPTYDPAFHNYAYLDVRSNYQDGATNMVSSVPLYYVGYTSTWANVTQNLILNASTTYYAVINGTKLNQVPGDYPTIRWYYQDSAGSFLTRRHTTDGDSWGSDRPYETFLNYTYIPWNKTANSALVYSDPAQINLNLNGTPASGSSWSINSAATIEHVEIATNQSVNIFHNLTLSYRKDVTGNTYWIADSGSNPVMWNVTVDLVYPVVPETVTRFMNITTIPSDWTTNGLYLGNTPAGSQTQMGTLVFCSGLSDGTWTLSSTGPNYVTDLALSDHSDSSPIGEYVDILVDIDIDASIEDGASNPITGGTTNLTVFQASTVIYSSPTEIPATSGLSSFLWDISATTSGNGTHSIEVYWTNGTEAGYFTDEVFIYYPTSLVADDMVINDYTDNSFYVGVDFNQIFPARGLDNALVDVFYTFESEVNVSMDDQTNGRWDKTISTTGLTSGAYTLYVYAEGYAIENQSLVITVNLVVETLALNWSWSNENNITYLESTNLRVSYKEIGGTNIPNAIVNVTFDGTTYDLSWDPIDEWYWIQLNGSDFVTVPGTTILVVNAWKLGYAAQYNDSIQITINEVTGVVFTVDWDPIDRNITFIEQITITATYRYNSDPINDTWLGVWVRAYFGGHLGYVNFTYNSGLEVWQLTIDGSNYLGVTSVTVQANATGYSANPVIDTITVVQDIPSLSSSWSGSAYTTDYDTNAPLLIRVQDSIGSDINDATLTITVNGNKTPCLPGLYSLEISPPNITGVYQINVTMVRIGFTTTSIFLNLTVRATTELQISVISHEYEQWNLTATATYRDTLYSTPITGATVIMTLNGVDYILQYTAGVYTIEILLDVAPGSYTMSFSASEEYANPASGTHQLTVDAKRAVHIELVSEGNPSIEGQAVVLTATLLYNDTGLPVVGEDVFFVITINFVNGTVLVMDEPSQFDRTNTQGVATFSFEVPAGTIESIQAEAYYQQSRELWSASRAITVTAGPNPLFVILYFFFIDSIGRLVTISMIVLAVVATAYNRRVKPKKRLAMASLDNQLRMFIDLESLRHFMAVYLDRGTCVFYHPFTDERIQPDLISGFIAAITSVYGEIKGDGVRGTLEEIQYHGLRLNSYSGEKIIGILILEGEITPLLKDRLQFFVELFENQYEKDLEGWTGLVDCFDTEWIVSTLNAAFNYSWLLPHRIGPTQKVSKTDAKILDYMTAVRDERGEFYIRKLLSPLAEMLGMTEAQVLDRLLTLHDRNVIVPVNVQTVLQRQGMGLSNGQEGEDVTAIGLPPMPKEKEEGKEKPAPKLKKKPEKVVEEPIPSPEPEEKAEEPAPKAKMKPQKFVEEPTPTPVPEEKVEEPLPEPEPEKKEDEMEAFIKHVESLLVAEAEKKKETEKEEKE